MEPDLQDSALLMKHLEKHSCIHECLKEEQTFNFWPIEILKMKLDAAAAALLDLGVIPSRDPCLNLR